MPPPRPLWPARGPRSLLGVLVLSSAIAGPVAAQFSPGPLSSVHADLEGATKCLNCHGIKNRGEMGAQCIACHKGIARLAAEHRGLHGRDDRGACTTCHAEHKGRDSSLIDRAKLVPGAFDHAQTGWPLSGKHLALKCEACHKRENQSPGLLALEPKPNAAHGFIGLNGDCAACHKDPHDGRLGANCAECHRESDFHEVARERFPHDRTKYPLRGAHAKVDCAKCHDPVTAWGRKPAYGSCSACHTDAHAGQALISGQRVDCNACHSEDGFTVTSFDRSRHRNTAFALEGKHVEVACEKCHPKQPKDVAPGSLGAAGVLIRRPHARCDDCHADAHAGQFLNRADKGDCRACHTVESWKKSQWDVKQHQALAFPLTGRHAKVPCADCHGPNRPRGSGANAAGAIGTVAGRVGDPAPGGVEATAGAGAAAAGTAQMLFKLSDTTCLSCHIDPHAGKYAAAESDTLGGKRACASCHDTERFHPSRVDVREHARFAYPLDGAHRAVACVTCHPDLARPPLASSLIGRAVSGSQPAGIEEISFARKHEDCVDCHKDVHEGQLRGPCSRCHDTAAFRPPSRFVHDRDAAFPLAGAHSKVACDRCHPAKDNGSGRRIITFRPVPVACAACHTETPGTVPPAETGPKGAPPA